MCSTSREGKDMSDDEILNQEQTMEALGNISLSTLYRMMHRGEITPVEETPILKRRRSLRFYRREIDRALHDAKDKEDDFRSQKSVA